MLKYIKSMFIFLFSFSVFACGTGDDFDPQMEEGKAEYRSGKVNSICLSNDDCCRLNNDCGPDQAFICRLSYDNFDYDKREFHSTCQSPGGSGAYCDEADGNEDCADGHTCECEDIKGSDERTCTCLTIDPASIPPDVILD